MKDQLFMPKPGFFDAERNGPYYCGDSVAVEGLLGFFPSLRTAVDVHYIDFQRPRKPVVDLLGEGHQSLPVLVLGSNADVDADADAETEAKEGTLEAKTVQGRRFIDEPDAIRRYLSTRYRVALPK